MDQQNMDMNPNNSSSEAVLIESAIADSENEKSLNKDLRVDSGVFSPLENTIEMEDLEKNDISNSNNVPENIETDKVSAGENGGKNNAEKNGEKLNIIQQKIDAYQVNLKKDGSEVANISRDEDSEDDSELLLLKDSSEDEVSAVIESPNDDNKTKDTQSPNKNENSEKAEVTSLSDNSTEEIVEDTIEMIEKTIMIPTEFDSTAVISIHNDNIAIVSEEKIMDGSINEHTTETVEFNVIEYTDGDGNQELKFEKVESSKRVESAPEVREVVRMSGRSSENKIDELLQKVTKSENVVIDDSAKMGNGECNSEEHSKKGPKKEESETISSPEKKRSVIESIYDDWMDENPEEDFSGYNFKSDDDVEEELKNLLDDNKSIKTEVKIQNSSNSPKKYSSGTPTMAITKSEESSKTSTPLKMKKEILIKKSPIHTSPKMIGSFSDSSESKNSVKKLLLTSKSGVKSDLVLNPLSTSDDASKVFKDIKSKDFKISSKEIIILKKGKPKPECKLSPISSPVTPVIGSDGAEKTTEIETKTSGDKELIAILEGDVDPDWSDLKPPMLQDEAKNNDIIIEHTSPPKLDPLIERELALKQLLELPSTPKKASPKKKLSPVKSPVKNRLKEVTKESEETSKTVVNIDLVEKEADDATEQKEDELISIDLTISEQSDQTKADKIDETRSGRKRKPTEKAREHEISAKRQKIMKGKPTTKKTRIENSSSESQDIDDHISSTEEVSTASVETDKNQNMKTSEKSSDVKEKETDEKIDSSEVPDDSTKKSKETPVKKTTQSNAKKKVVRPKVQATKKSSSKNVNKKPVTKVTKATKKTPENSTTEPKPKKKNAEIDRLLQDEGVVNLLYDVEQPGKKRLVPVTKSHAKVMDMQKIQRELKIRTKLVRNAVLRLRTSSTTPSAVTSRSKRSIHGNDQQQSAQSSPIEKKTQETSKSPRSSISSSSEFIFPAKIRSAHESIIVRRHSSSSFSSASGSPRVSVDTADRQSLDPKMDENHALRSNKRRLSQDDKKKASNDAKRMKKDDSKVNEASPTIKNKTIAAGKAGKKVETKKAKNSKQEVEESEVTPSKNAKNKKVARSKVSFAKENDDEDIDEPTEKDDALSACLAEAVTALANDNSVRTRAGIVNRKIKTRGSDVESVKAKDKVQFSNKEIIVQRHGNFVQLILTPSTSSKIKNGLTLQIMQEFRDALTILKKDDDCRVVLLTSTGSSFCEGLELSTLLHDNKDARRAHAQELANGVKDFIKSLATFNKPIVAGVQGSAVGLGVTMLPLFDLVIASDKASFSTPYGKLGQIAEGAAVFTLSHVLGSVVTNELLLGGRTLTASEALRAGLVTRVLWPDRFQVELLPFLRAMSEQSAQSMVATKALLRHSLRKKLDAALESESYVLIQHWCSQECQEAIRTYLDEKVN
ncbi:uncharacterized protein [Chelonus insularis]|uniref:uncharacterized protein n=1 Tax=Chelonus insularis TaxID=460826 RepID=UPI00158E07B8|nr:uncharacterized protein LOC118067998 [Chelonus insularis]